MASKIYRVDVVSMFKLTYLVEAECVEYANDLVVCNDSSDNAISEVDQQYLGETLISTREIASDEYEHLRSTAINGHVIDDLIIKS